MHRVIVASSTEGCQTTEKGDRLLGLIETQTEMLAGQLRHNREATVENCVNLLNVSDAGATHE